MPATKLEFVGWDEATRRASETIPNFKHELVGEVQVVAEFTNDRIFTEMPVDTGWAQARWGEPAFGGIWEVSPDRLTITQGSFIEPFEYIQKLNEGSSSQAPAGFIDRAADDGGRMLENYVVNAFNRIQW